MIASLPMYDRAETAGANDRLWSAIRDRLRAQGIDAPDALIHGAPDLWPHWTAPDLVLSQTCGYPYRSRLHGTVTLVGTPDYGVEDCDPGFYRSVFVVRTDDPRQTLAEFEGARLAWNDDLSQSGWAGPQTHLARLGIHLVPTLRTGGHKLSAIAVSEGRADIAALDAVTWQLIRRFDGFAASLKAIATTDPSPGLPLISRKGMDASALFDAVAASIADMPGEDRQVTGLRGIVRIPAERYLAVPTPPPPAL